ncbi:MAG: lipid-A-disaccharide synthase [Phycisphaerae bacterium]|nr:lipid-A-disaccharide synthase [Phycisphaerae bacterium]
MQPRPTIVLTAAEASGDQHAANLAIALRRRIPDARLVAFGGPRLAEAGVELLADLTGRSAMLFGALARVPNMLRRLWQFDRFLLDEPVALHITVDSPAANLPFAGRSKSHGVPVLAYVAPQLWAWGDWRMDKLRRRVDRIACILPFEPEFFAKYDVPATFVGHPIFEPLVDFRPDAGFIATLPAGSPKIALLPGSRGQEITNHLPAQLRIAAALRKKFPQAAFVVAAPPPGHGHSLDVAAMVAGSPAQLVPGRLHDVLAWSDAVLAVSGSVTLEVAWFARPMVVMYKTIPWMWNLIGRRLLKPTLLALPNIIAGRRVVPEFLPWFGDDAVVLAEMESLLADPERQATMRRELGELVKPLAAINASDRVAELAAEMITA